MFKNRHFPFDVRLPIKELASDVNAALHQLRGGRCRLHYALDIATQDRTPLNDRVVDDIRDLRDLLERAYDTPDGARWVRETLRDAAAPPRPDRAESSASDSSTTTGQRRREEPSSGRGSAKRATLPGTSDSDSNQHPRRPGRDRLDRRQVPPRVANPRIEDAPGADSPPSLQHMVEAVTAAAIAAVDRHLAHMGLHPRSEPASSRDFVTNARPLMTPAPVATPLLPASSVAPTNHSAAVSTDNAYSFVNTAPVATPPPPTGSVAPTTHPAGVSMNNTYTVVAPAPVSAPLPPADSVVPTANPAPAPSRIAPPPLRPRSPLL